MKNYWRVVLTVFLIISVLSIFAGNQKNIGDEKWIFRRVLLPSQWVESGHFSFYALDEKGWTYTSAFKKNEDLPYRFFLEKSLNYGQEGYGIELNLVGPLGPIDWEETRKAYQDLCKNGPQELDLGTFVGVKQKTKLAPGEWNQAKAASGNLFFDCARITEWFGPGPKWFEEEITLVKQMTDRYGVEVRYKQKYFINHRDPLNRSKAMKIVESITFDEKKSL